VDKFKEIKKFTVFMLLLVTGLTVMHFANIQNAAAAVGYDELLETAGQTIELPSYDEAGTEHGNAYEGEGLTGITSSIYYVIDFIKYILGGLAVLFMMISAFRLLTAGEGSDEEINKQKEYFFWAITGLILIFMADTIVKDMFFGAEGEIFLEGQEQALEFGDRANKEIKGIYTLIEIFVSALAVFAIAYDGVRMIAGAYSEEQINSAKNHIFWSIIGLVMIGISELLVKDILFPYKPGEGVTLGISQGKLLIASITNFVSGLIGLASVGALVAGGYMYLTGGVSEENTGKGKKIIMGAIIGIILAGAAYAITNTVIGLGS